MKSSWWGENPDGLVDLIHKLHGSCGYSGVPRMKNLCQLIEQQLRNDVREEELEPEFLELLDEMDNVAREAKKNIGGEIYRLSGLQTSALRAG
ncbi:BarA sensory histidine kinase (VarS / GacS) [Salmonella bongori]|nr:BarA sensory histidine kinase (VarS / GacS) [Salmonella bongori]